MPRVLTSHDDIVRVIECHKVGLNSVQIANQTGVKERTVRNLIKRFKAGGSRDLPVQGHGGGVPKNQSPRTLKLLKRQLENNPTLTARKLKEDNPDLLAGTSVRTIQKRISGDLGFSKVSARAKPPLTKKHVKDRLAFAKKYLKWPVEKWQRVLWSDESKFAVSDPSGLKVWVRKGANKCLPKYTAKKHKFPASVMVWGGFGYGGVSELVVLPKGLSVNQNVYYTLLNDHLEESFDRTGCDIFQQDGAPAHTAKGIISWFKDCGLEYIPDWPGNSPDLNPIENLWAILKAKIRDRDTSTVDKLVAELQSAWANLNPEHLQNLAKSIPTRLQMVIDAKGQPINY